MSQNGLEVFTTDPKGEGAKELFAQLFEDEGEPLTTGGGILAELHDDPGVELPAPKDPQAAAFAELFDGSDNPRAQIQATM